MFEKDHTFASSPGIRTEKLLPKQKEPLSRLYSHLASEFPQFGKSLWKIVFSDLETELLAAQLSRLVTENRQILREILTSQSITAQTTPESQLYQQWDSYFTHQTTQELLATIKTLRQKALFAISAIVFFQGEKALPATLLDFCTDLGDWKDRVHEKITDGEMLTMHLDQMLAHAAAFPSDVYPLGDRPISQALFMHLVRTRLTSIHRSVRQDLLSGEEMHTLRKQVRNFFHLSILLKEHAEIPISSEFRNALVELVPFFRQINKELGEVRDQYLVSDLTDRAQVVSEPNRQEIRQPADSEPSEINHQYLIPPATAAKIRAFVTALSTQLSVQ